MTPYRELAVVDAELVINKRTFGVTLKLRGRLLPTYPGGREQPTEPGGLVVDKVMLGAEDISSELPAEAMEELTTIANTPDIGEGDEE